MLTAVEIYPDFEEQVRDLAHEHLKTRRGRLRLAVYFAPLRRGKRDVFLFEVIEGFGADEVEPEGKFFEFRYGSTSAFPLAPGSSLHMVLSNPVEFKKAVEDDWKGVRELRAARRAGKATLIFADAVGKRLWGLVK